MSYLARPMKLSPGFGLNVRLFSFGSGCHRGQLRALMKFLRTKHIDPERRNWTVCKNAMGNNSDIVAQRVKFCHITPLRRGSGRDWCIFVDIGRQLQTLNKSIAEEERRGEAALSSLRAGCGPSLSRPGLDYDDDDLYC